MAVAVLVAGGVGALARWLLDGAISRRFSGFPWGTFVVNVTGAFVLGLLFTLLTERVTVSPWVRAGLTTGLLGGYTTFSTLSLETYRLLEDGSVGLAVANAVGSIGAGLVAVYLGIVLGRAI